MAQQPKCAFWNFTTKGGSPDCDRPASCYRFHGPPGKMDRLALYCFQHNYDRYASQAIAPEILERARAEGWPFMEWPPPSPPQEVFHVVNAHGVVCHPSAVTLEDATQAMEFASEVGHINGPYHVARYRLVGVEPIKITEAGRARAHGLMGAMWFSEPPRTGG